MTKKQQRIQDRQNRHAVYRSEWWLGSEVYRRLRYEHGYIKLPRQEGDEWQKWEQMSVVLGTPLLLDTVLLS